MINRRMEIKSLEICIKKRRKRRYKVGRKISKEISLLELQILELMKRVV